VGQKNKAPQRERSSLTLFDTLEEKKDSCKSQGGWEESPESNWFLALGEDKNTGEQK